MSDTSADARLLIDAGIAMLRDSPSGRGAARGGAG